MPRENPVKHKLGSDKDVDLRNQLLQLFGIHIRINKDLGAIGFCKIHCLFRQLGSICDKQIFAASYFFPVDLLLRQPLGISHFEEHGSRLRFAVTDHNTEMCGRPLANHQVVCIDSMPDEVVVAKAPVNIVSDHPAYCTFCSQSCAGGESAGHLSAALPGQVIHHFPMVQFR
ncbi:unknown [Firmicutes bacterium CAG:791]|nr:unknown [Firmicutes bacterium CAG:791]